MFQYMVGVAMLHGHDPREAADYPWADLQIMTMLHNNE